MSESLHARATFAIEESRKLHAEKLRLQADYLEHLKALQLSVLESAMLRMEIKAHRDDKGGDKG